MHLIHDTHEQTRHILYRDTHHSLVRQAFRPNAHRRRGRIYNIYTLTIIKLCQFSSWYVFLHIHLLLHIYRLLIVTRAQKVWQWRGRVHRLGRCWIWAGSCLRVTFGQFLSPLSGKLIRLCASPTKPAVFNPHEEKCFPRNE